jgi:hypothetical protein
VWGGVFQCRLLAIRVPAGVSFAPSAVAGLPRLPPPSYIALGDLSLEGSRMSIARRTIGLCWAPLQASDGVIPGWTVCRFGAGY